MARSYPELMGLQVEAERLVRMGESRAEVSRRLGVHPQTLAQWALQGGWRKKDLDMERQAEATTRTLMAIRKGNRQADEQMAARAALEGFMRQAVEAHTDPLDRIRATARAYIHFGVTHPDEYAFVFMQRRPHAPNESARVQHGDPLQDPYAFARALFAQWAATGVVRDLDVDVDLMTQIFWEGIHGFTARHLVMGLDDTWMPEVPNEAHRDLMIEVLLTGLAAAFAPR